MKNPRISEKQIENVLKLDAQKRYEYALKIIVDWDMVWGLYNDGWALASDDDGQIIFPLWPTYEYAKVCAINEWQKYEPVPIALEDLVQELLPNLKHDNVKISVFYVPNNKGSVIDSEDFLKDINIEKLKYD
jgi:hypothetical protein